jgi:hypothetical protein
MPIAKPITSVMPTEMSSFRKPSRISAAFRVAMPYVRAMMGPIIGEISIEATTIT